MVIVPVYNGRDNIEQICSSSTVRKALQIEMGLGAWRKDFRIKEVPIVFEGRRVGESKMSKKIVREAIWMLWKLRLMSLLGKLYWASGTGGLR